MKHILIILKIIIFGSLSAQTIVTDRPDQTESSSTVGQGVLQIESGVLIGFTSDNISTTRELLLPTTLFRLGITNGIELRLVNQLESLKRLNNEVLGISDMEIGTKIELLQSKNAKTEIAILSHLILPSGTSGLSNKNYGTINKLSVAHQLSDRIGLGYNLGYDYLKNGSNGSFTYSLALGIGINDKVAVYVEPYGAYLEFETLEASMDAGLTYLLNDDFQLDFSFGTGINYRMNYISVGFSWRTGKSKSE